MCWHRLTLIKIYNPFFNSEQICRNPLLRKASQASQKLVIRKKKTIKIWYMRLYIAWKSIKNDTKYEINDTKFSYETEL